MHGLLGQSNVEHIHETPEGLLCRVIKLSLSLVRQHNLDTIINVAVLIMVMVKKQETMMIDFHVHVGVGNGSDEDDRDGVQTKQI